MKVKIRELNEKDLNKLRDKNIKSLREMKKKGKSKKDCYEKFTRSFVDRYYE